MARNTTTSREAKAQELLDSGAVQLHIGLGVATVQGSGGSVYRVSRGTGCDCPDRQRRGQTCKHEIAAKQLCDEYKACRTAAERGETIRPSRHLLQAIRWPTFARAKVRGCKECGAPTDFDVCSGCFFGQRGAA